MNLKKRFILMILVYELILGMEHENSRSDKAGEQAVIDAYLKVDQFL